MDEVLLFEWAFTPSDYFGEPVKLRCTHGTINIENGCAVLQVPVVNCASDHSVRSQLHEELDALFLAAQVLSHKPYKLDSPKVSKRYPDGRIDAWGTFSGVEAVGQVSGIGLDTTHSDPSGTVIHNSHRPRLQERNDFAQLAAHHMSDHVANGILRSYSAAVNDPNNELVHLYEIYDVLKKHFNGVERAISKLGANKDWEPLHKLANFEPLRQGRHRGQSLGRLRDATVEELATARKIARDMIKRYLRFLN